MGRWGFINMANSMIFSFGNNILNHTKTTNVWNLKKESINVKADFHIHTKYSMDCHNELEDIVNAVRNWA